MSQCPKRTFELQFSKQKATTQLLDINVAQFVRKESYLNQLLTPYAKTLKF